ncbi:MAG: DUF4363 family protein [Clostridiales bacterium]|jgi:hypothetical protein|nr:DUF4363 family protein [Clostridiales bacterium]
MKKEIVTGIIFLLIFALTLVNIYVLKNLTDGLLDLIDQSRAYAEKGDWENAISKAKEAEERWNRADPYTHIVIRHSEIDSATDAFYDLLKALYSEEAGNAKGAYMALTAHITSIEGMDKVKLGSIF